MPNPTRTVDRSRIHSTAIIMFGVFALAPMGHQTIARSDDKGTDKKEPILVLKGPAADELVRLKREVDALETLHHLEPTQTQLKNLLSLAQKTAANSAVTTQVSASAPYRQTLLDLHNALVKNDEEQVAALYAKLADLQDATPAVLTEEFEITDAAMKAAPAALKNFTAAQVVSYLAAMESEVPDPVERILITLSEGVALNGEEWSSLRDETADEVAWLIHGFHADMAEGAKKAIANLLDRGHRLKPDEFTKEVDLLEQTARKIAGGVSPIVVLQHIMERELAEFLSNPRATAALKARIDAPKN